jgi:hypothetical protein
MGNYAKNATAGFLDDHKFIVYYFPQLGNGMGHCSPFSFVDMRIFRAC